MFVEGKPKGLLRFIPAKVLELAYQEDLSAALQRLKERLEE